MDAAVQASKAAMGFAVDDDAARNGWESVQNLPKPSLGCFEVHPGLCARHDRAVVSKVPSFVRQLPKQDALIRLERNGVVVFALMLVGLGSDWLPLARCKLCRSVNADAAFGFPKCIVRAIGHSFIDSD